MATSPPACPTPTEAGSPRLAARAAPSDAAAVAARTAAARRSGLSVLLGRDPSAVGLDVDSMEPLPDEAVFLPRSRSSFDSWDELQLLHQSHGGAAVSNSSPRRWGGGASASAGRVVQRNCLRCGFLFIDMTGAKFCSPVCGHIYEGGHLP